jgi:hypothetical protein
MKRRESTNKKKKGIKIVPGAIEFVRWAAQHYRLALATSATPRNRTATLDSLGLANDRNWNRQLSVVRLELRDRNKDRRWRRTVRSNEAVVGRHEERCFRHQSEAAAATPICFRIFNGSKRRI